jgi:LysR family transcriptional regulator, glycine cleavage system transcriptional activator
MNALAPLNAMRAFEAAARAGSFAKAAVGLHVTHWAIGKQNRASGGLNGLPSLSVQFFKKGGVTPN